MSKETNYSLVNLGKLSKPANTLIEKVSKGVGGIFAPFQIKRIAKAEAEAAITKAQTEIVITDLHKRAGYRFIEEQARHQKNMEDITAKAIPHLEQDANPDAMEDDWVANFFDKCRIVSDDDMQQLWSRVLAGEANDTGTYSKRTVNFLSDLDKTDAEIITKLCRFLWKIGAQEVVPLVFNHRAPIYTEHGIDFDGIVHLESIGFVKFGSFWEEFASSSLPERTVARYYNQSLTLQLSEKARNNLHIGKLLLTKVGQELAPICESQPVIGFYEYVRDEWKEYLLD